MKLKLFAFCAAFLVLSASLCGCKNVEVSFSVADSENSSSKSDKESTSLIENKAETSEVQETSDAASEPETTVSEASETEIPEETTDPKNNEFYEVWQTTAPETEEDNSEIIEETVPDTEISAGEVFSPESSPEQNDYGAYGNILDNFYYMISNGSYGNGIGGETGVLEATIEYEDRQEALAAVGFKIEDLSGDGIPELIIASNSSESNYGTPIYALYSCVYGEPALTFQGVARSNYRLMYDGNFCYRGSGGAAYSSFGNYTLSYDGTSLIRNYYYHTEPTEITEDGYYDTIIYRDNSNGESEETDMTIDDFADMAEDLSYMTVRLDLTPFSEYTPKA